MREQTGGKRRQDMRRSSRKSIRRRKKRKQRICLMAVLLVVLIYVASHLRFIATYPDIRKKESVIMYSFTQWMYPE